MGTSVLADLHQHFFLGFRQNDIGSQEIPDPETFRKHDLAHVGDGDVIRRDPQVNGHLCKPVQVESFL